MGNLAIAVQILLSLLDRASEIGALIAKAQGEGRDVTPEELDTLSAKDDVAKAALAAAIAAARG